MNRPAGVRAIESRRGFVLGRTLPFEVRLKQSTVTSPNVGRDRRWLLQALPS